MRSARLLLLALAAGPGDTVVEKQATAGRTGRFLAKDAPVPAACILQ